MTDSPHAGHSQCIRHSELPGASALFLDLLYHYDRVAAFYPHRPGDPEAAAQLARQMHFPDERRAALVAALREMNTPSASLELLAQPGTVAVLTGQQVGLLGGPCYTIFKALTAVKMAALLTAEGTPAVPVFWLATEDHDFAEINQAWIFDPTGAPRQLSATTAPAQAGAPVGGTPLGDFSLAELETALADLPFGAELMADVRAHYSDGTFDGAFLGLMQRWFNRFGLLFVDPLRPAFRELAAPILAQAALATPELMPALRERNRELAAAGYHAQVHLEPDTALLFLLENGQRKKLEWRNGAFTAKDQTWTPAELAARGAALSGNALLRPVVQDWMFPTVAVVGGPAELAYFAQSEVLYRRLLGHIPVPVSRAGFTLISARAQKLLERYGLRVEQTFQRADLLQQRIAATLVPAEVATTLGGAREEIGRQLDRVRTQLAGFDATLVAALDKSRAKMLHQVAKLEAKAAREAMRRNERAAQEAAYLTHWLYPEQHLQERLYSAVPLLATYGPDLLDNIYASIHLDCPDHQALAL